MNYLQLTNDYLIETGAGDTIGSVVGQSDEYLQATKWIADAWVEIQRNRNWNFRWAEDSFSTVIGQYQYTLTDTLRVSGDDPLKGSFYYRLPDGRYSRLCLTTYQHSRAVRNAGNVAQGVPNSIAFSPAGDMYLHPTPDAVSSIKYEYHVAPVVLVDDLDFPSMSPEFHKAIVWKAVEQYAREQGKEWRNLYQVAVRNFNAIYSKMLEHETGRAYLAPSPFTYR